MNTPESGGVEKCGEHYDRHPTLPHLVAVCAKPAGHHGEHSNVLLKNLASLLDTAEEVTPPGATS